MMNNINLQIDAAARQASQNGKAVYLTQTERKGYVTKKAWSMQNQNKSM